MVRKTTKLRSSSNEKYKLIWKVGLIAALIIFSCWQLIPSIKFFYLSEEEQVEMDPGKFEKIRSKALNLGLDLQGGIHLVMQVDTSGMEADEANDSVDKAMTVIANRVDQFGLVEPVVQRQGSNRIIIELPGMKDVERAKRLIGQTARLEFKFLRSDEDIAFITEKIDLHLSGGAQDTTTVAEEDSTAVDLFGEQEQADDNLKKFTRFLSYQKIPGGIPSFDMLSEREDVPRMNAILADAEVMKIIEDARVMFLWGPENARSDGLRELFLLDAQSVMTGEMVRDAQVKMGSGMDAAKPEISFDTTSEGVREWARITGANIGKR
ncbi:MAG: hypothetical protein HOC71_15700, partial [Candidatus Latescibacteria bacterium]|nr:hypothetical protein [Candidatus Latescibacterota bacterium]